MSNKVFKEQNQKVSILYVHYGENWIRGSEIVLLDLLKFAKGYGYYPVLWCNNQILATKAAELGIEVILETFVCLGYWTKPKWDFLKFCKLLIKAKRLILQYKISLVHCNNGAPCQWMAPICKLTSTPILLHLHAKYLYRDRLTLFFHSVDNIIGVSQSVIESFKKKEFTHQQVSVIYNGIEPERALSLYPRNIRAELSASDSDFIILYIGSLIHRKSVHKILHALNSLKNDEIKLAIFGSGSEKKNLLKLVKELDLQNNVKFFLPTDNVASLYSSDVDCFISVPLEEVFGLTLAEASIARLPIITSNVAGINEIYSNNENALLVNPENSEELVSAIKSLINSPGLRNRLARNAHTHIMENYSLQKQFIAFIHAYQSLLTKKVSQGFLAMFTLQLSKLCIAFFNKISAYLFLKMTWGKRDD